MYMYMHMYVYAHVYVYVYVYVCMYVCTQSLKVSGGGEPVRLLWSLGRPWDPCFSCTSTPSVLRSLFGGIWCILKGKARMQGFAIPNLLQMMALALF